LCVSTDVYSKEVSEAQSAVLFGGGRCVCPRPNPRANPAPRLDEYINAFGTDSWRETIRTSHEQFADHMSPDPQSPPPDSPPGGSTAAKSRSLATLGISEKQPASEGGRYRTPGALAAIALAGLKTAATTAKADPSLLSG